MIQEPEVTPVYGVTKLIDTLLNFKMDSKEFISNEKIVTRLGEAIDKLNSAIAGHTLLSITRDKTRNLLLITKKNSSFTIYKWKLNESIDKLVGVEVHEENSEGDIPEFLEQNCAMHLHKDELASALVIESLNGYSTNKTSARLLMSLKNKDEKHGPATKDKAIEVIPEAKELIPLGRRILSKIDTIKSDTKKTIEDLLEKNEIKMTIEHEFPSYGRERIFVGEMTNVKEIGGRRHFEVKWVSLRKFNDQVKYGRVTASCSPAVGAANMTSHGNIYVYNKRIYGNSNDQEFEPGLLGDIPFNFVDKGRLIIAVPESSYEWNVIIGPDPRIIESHRETLEKDIGTFLTEEIENSHELANSLIEIPSIKATIFYHSYESSQKRINPDLKGLRLKLKSLKVMIDEHNYLVKKNEAIGEDVTVTENIKYNHEEGKISYNDFSIAIKDDLVKSKLFELFNNYLMKYFRTEATEQDILDSLVNDIFDAIGERLNTGAKNLDLNLPITINNKINVNVTGKVSTRYAAGSNKQSVISTGQLFYINDQRFNKNEILMVLREMTCYREQAEADNFINNIGRLGLSTYIGISTGYEVSFGQDENKLFRFKKIKGGRSNYELLLDETTIPIKGKKLINLLYSRFIGEHVPDFLGKIPSTIYELSGSSMHYLKYKVLIDATYKAFKDKSKEYLNKKVEELNGTHVKYYNKKAHKVIDGVLIQGTSGKTYVIAYDLRDSYVFVDTTKGEDDVYRDGKYICMIDQSNIKSNISYDTIVSKLMALKHDSSIAHTIYNLQEELE